MSNFLSCFKHFSKNAENLSKRLLEYNPKKRLKYKDIISHPFFKGTNWEKIERLETNPPFIPEINENNLFEYFDSEKELYDEYTAHEKRNKTLDGNDNIRFGKDSLFEIDNNKKENMLLNSEYNDADQNGSILINKCNDCKYDLDYNDNSRHNNDNEIEEDEFANYKISDLNNNLLNRNLTLENNNDNYFPGFSFSTSDEEENKL